MGIELIDGDPHIWMDPERYAQQGINIAEGLGKLYPEYAQTLLENARLYQDTLLHEYEAWKRHLSDLSEREMVTFHDGFAYFADAFDLTILAAIEEEEGAEPSAAELEEICRLVREHNLKSIFVETNGSTAAAEIVSKETGVLIGELNLIMSHQDYDYIEDMYKNVYEVKADLEWHTS